jgi:hypothetical protein
MPNTPNSVLVLDQFGRVPALGSGIAGVTDGSNARGLLTSRIARGLPCRNNRAPCAYFLLRP